MSVERLSPASIDRLLGLVDGCAAYRRQNTAIFEQVATEMVARARIAAADRHLVGRHRAPANLSVSLLFRWHWVAGTYPPLTKCPFSQGIWTPV